MPKRLAITISGAVSLGSYEAGVLYEVIHAIGEHNKNAPDDQKILIDVLTGASAGGMTAVIAAQKLLFEADSLSQPYDNSFYRPWVKEVDIEFLLDLERTEEPTHSIFSSNLVDRISKNHITLRYATGMPPSKKRHAAAADKIRLGLALSNLNGVDWQRTVLPNQNFIYTQYQDEVKRELDFATDDHLVSWEFLRNAAVACGAFPFAFRTKELARHQREYANTAATAAHLKPFPSDPHSFTYTDGGVFQNQPLGLAKDLVDLQDPGHTNTEKRFYLYIAPGSKGSTCSTAFSESTANLGQTLKQLIGAIFNQAQFHDWIKAESINDQIALFNQRAMDIHAQLLHNPKLAPDLQTGASALLPFLIPNPIDRAAAQERVRDQWHAEFTTLSSISPLVASAWIDSILAIESAANLGDKDEMRIYGITADESELAGAKIEAFLGFFDQSYRQHDYDLGRTKAREFIQNLNRYKDAQGNPDPLAPINYTPSSTINPINHNLNGLKLSQVPVELRQRVKDRLTERAHALLEELGINFIGRQAIDFFFLTPQLKNMFSL